jgi:dienelactone hydrolase
VRRAAGLCSALVLPALVAACGSGSGQTASQTPSRAATSSTQVRRVDGCVPLAGGARSVALHPPRSKPLRGVMLGAGTTAFVFSDESDEDLCSWLPFVKTLRRHGYSVLLYDYVDPSALPADAVAGAAAARAAGARRVILIGASVGARGSIKAASANPPGVVGVVSLSAERTVSSDPTDLVGPAARVTLPALLISARGDPFAQGATGPLLRAMPSRRKRALMLPGVDHGTALLTGGSGPRVQRAILAFAASE